MNITESPKWLELPVEVRRKKVLDEIAINRELNNGNVDLNNFYCYFFPPQYDYLSNARLLLVSFAGNVDKPIYENRSQRDMRNYSSLFIHQTPQQFFAELDRIALEQNIDLGQIHTLLAEMFQLTQRGLYKKENTKKLQRHISIVNQLHKMLLPVYTELRILGYNDTDLGVN